MFESLNLPTGIGTSTDDLFAYHIFHRRMTKTILMSI